MSTSRPVTGLLKVTLSAQLIRMIEFNRCSLEGMQSVHPGVWMTGLTIHEFFPRMLQADIPMRFWSL
jgi:hypothetical protein